MEAGGNVFEADGDYTFTGFDAFLRHTDTGCPLGFFVYEATDFSGPWTVVAAVERTFGTTGDDYYSSGPLSVPLSTGNYYAFVAANDSSGTPACAANVILEGTTHYAQGSNNIGFGAYRGFALDDAYPGFSPTWEAAIINRSGGGFPYPQRMT